MKILVTGGQGFVGSAAVAVLRGAGHDVVRLVRRPGPLADDEWYWDPVRGEVDARLGAGVDAVVHLAGENIAAGRWTASRKTRIRESRVRGTEVLVGALSRAERPPAVLVAASATGIYGDRGNEELDEDAGPGNGFLAEVAKAWEGAATALEATGARVVCLRMGMVLDGGGGALAKMLPVFRWGLGGVLGSGGQYWSWIHRVDLARIVLLAVTDQGMRGPINAVAPNPVTNREFTRVLAGVVGRPAWLPAPRFGLRCLLGEMADAILLGSARVMPRRLQAMGYAFRYADLREALVVAVSARQPGARVGGG